MKTKVIILKGLPSSGKSTFSKELVDKDHSYKRISMDDLRSMVDNGYWNFDKTEKLIVALRDTMLEVMLYAKHNIIIDATNLHPKHEKQIRQIVDDYNEYNDDQAVVEIKDFFHVPMEECIERDSKREKPVGEKVIRDMAQKYNLSQVKTVYNPNLPDAIIVDIDGTLAHNSTGRGFFDWDRVGEDTVDATIANLVNKHHQDCSIIVVSGRDVRCKNITEDWLYKAGVWYDNLYMRPLGNTEPDEKIKTDIYNQFIKDRYNILFVLDDRGKVVKRWRELGLKVFQVAEGNF